MGNRVTESQLLHLWLEKYYEDTYVVVVFNGGIELFHFDEFNDADGFYRDKAAEPNIAELWYGGVKMRDNLAKNADDR